MYHLIAFACVSLQSYGWAFSLAKLVPPRNPSTIWSHSSTLHSNEDYILFAVQCAEKGYGHTFPNPAVGCVLVDDSTGEVIGSGFHPRAGYPHAEIFALLEAAGHVESGITAAESIVHTERNLTKGVDELIKLYATECGPSKLFADCFAGRHVTAFVTLEPCSHYGRTPPCAQSLVLAKVKKVVIGFPDPNPLVNGGGVKLLESCGVSVSMAVGETGRNACAKLVENFCRRIVYKPHVYHSEEPSTGKSRIALRSVISWYIKQREVKFIEWDGDRLLLNEHTELAISHITIKPEWLEHVDSLLWRHETVGLKLTKAVPKRKFAKLLGDRIAKILKAKVAQTRGHTVLVFRPLRTVDDGLQ